MIKNRLRTRAEEGTLHCRKVTAVSAAYLGQHITSPLFKIVRNLKFKSPPTVAFLAAVNHNF